MLNNLVIVVMACVGIVAGPFLRVEIIRHAVASNQQPQDGCPNCRAPLARRGRLWVRTPLPPSGRCPRCGYPLGPPPGSVELVTAGVLALLAWRMPEPLTLVGLSWAALVGVVLSFVDVRVHRLPNQLMLAGVMGTLLMLTVAAIWRQEVPRLGVAVLCALGTAAAYLLLALIPRGYGLGDVKVAALVGLATGWFGINATVVAFASAVLIHGVIAVVAAVRRRTLSGSIAHGPSMLAGALLAILVAG